MLTGAFPKGPHSRLAPGDFPLQLHDALSVPYQQCSEHAVSSQSTPRSTLLHHASQGGHAAHTASAGSCRKAANRHSPNLPSLEHSLLPCPRDSGQNELGMPATGTVVLHREACTGTGMSDVTMTHDSLIAFAAMWATPQNLAGL